MKYFTTKNSIKLLKFGIEKIKRKFTPMCKGAHGKNTRVFQCLGNLPFFFCALSFGPKAGVFCYTAGDKKFFIWSLDLFLHY